MTLSILILYIVLLINSSLVSAFFRQMRLQHYKKSRLTGYSIESMKGDLDRYILQKEPFLDPYLKSADLASEIGLECGFNSSSAFYSAYRKVTGSSPRK